MPAKPFPFPIGVGVDIAETQRFIQILQKGDFHVLLLARKIFTQLEWPNLLDEFLIKSPMHPALQGTLDPLRLPGLLSSRHLSIHPDLPHRLKIKASKDPSASTRLTELNKVGHDSAWAILAQHVAGRWAAKEATVKAHRHRKVFYQDISVMVPGKAQKNNDASGMKPYALVRPPLQHVLMNDRVAKLRGLNESRSPESKDREVLLMQHHPVHPGYFSRPLSVKAEDYQIAEISISHETDHAVAVCMALDEAATEMGSAESVVDDGSGEPIHEPKWGDRGFFLGWKDDLIKPSKTWAERAMKLSLGQWN